MKSLLYLSLLTILVISCKKDPAPEFHRAYFGYQEGRYAVYDVVEIIHDAELDLHDTSIYELKTVWGQSYMDNEGRELKEFLRYKRSDNTQDWTLSDLWTGGIVGNRGELVEENQRIVKLVFAPTFSKQWNANAFNAFDPQDCYYDDFHESRQIGGLNFDSTLTVRIALENNLIDSVDIFERYAKGVGLVYKHLKDNHYQFTDEVELGRELYYTIKETGIE